MKGRLIVLKLVLLISLSSTSQTSYTWNSSGSTSFSTASNWSPNGNPVAGDDVIFDGTSTVNCILDEDINIENLTITSAYTGTIDALSSLPIIIGSFSQDGGVFISTDDLIQGLTIGRNFSLTGGTFNHNGGLVVFAVDPTNGTSTISGNVTFNAIAVGVNGLSTSQRNIDFGNSNTSTLTLNCGTRLFGFQGTVTITSALSLIGTNTGNPTGNTGTFLFTGSGPISISGLSGSNAALRVRLPNIEVNTSGTVTITNNLNVTGNWTGSQGTLAAGTSTVNFHNTASISGTAAAFNNLVVQSGVTLSFPSNAEVSVSRSLVNNGTINSSATSLLSMNGGTVTQVISGNAFTMGSLRANSGSRTITLSTGLTILDSLKLENNVTLASGGNLTLNADASLQGRVATLGSGASVTGNVTVETFVPGPNTGWANWGVNGVSGQSVSHWEAQIPMTCEGCPYGVTALGEYFESIQSWDPTLDDYDSLITYTTPLDPGRGFWVYVGTSSSTTTPITLVHTGSLVQGSQNISVNNLAFAPNGYNLISNPFASPISWDIICSDNAGNFASELNDNTIYVYNTDIPATTSYLPGTGSSHGNGISNVIPVGQAFYIDMFNPGGTFNITINESAKIPSNSNTSNPLLKQQSINPKFRLKIQGAYDYDETLICFNPLATSGYDKNLDANKKFETPGYFGYPGAYSKYTSISTRANGKYLSINSMPGLSQSYTLDVLAKASSSGSYTISAKDFENFNSCLVLVDELNNIYHDLNSSPYVLQLSDTVNTPHFKLMVCESGNPVPTGIKDLQLASSITIVPEKGTASVFTHFDKDSKACISVYNLMGQKLISDICIEGRETSTRLPLELSNQIIIVKVNTDQHSYTKKVLIH